MTRSNARITAILTVAAVVAAAGCQQRQATEDETAAEGAPAPAAAPAPEAAEAPLGEAEGSELAVTNTMPHEMVVTARWGDPAAERVLGPVAPNETRTFELAAPPGAMVSLSARDAADTHGVEGTVSAEPDSAVAWTIQ